MVQIKVKNKNNRLPHEQANTVILTQLHTFTKPSFDDVAKYRPLFEKLTCKTWSLCSWKTSLSIAGVWSYKRVNSPRLTYKMLSTESLPSEIPHSQRTN